MTYSRLFRVIAIAVSVLVSFSFAAKNGKIRYAIGESFVITPKGKESRATTGGNVKEKDKIRTGVESRVVVALPDGSVVSVEENSLVEFVNLDSENGVQSAMTDIWQGKVRFEAQKQAEKSFFSFKTGTAVSAIRGTDGSVGISAKKRGVFGLASGVMDIKDECGASESIEAGQITMATGKCGFMKFTLKHAGEAPLMDQVLKLVDEELSYEEMQKRLNEIDQLLDNALKTKIKTTGCTTGDVPDTVSTSLLPLSITCTGFPQQLYINGNKFNDTKSFAHTIEWDPHALGLKHFDFMCRDSIKIAAISNKMIELEYKCGEAQTYYYNKDVEESNRLLQDSTSNEAFSVMVLTNNLCNKGRITLEGNVNSTGASAISFTLNDKTETIKLGELQKSFTHEIMINDRNENWTAHEIVATAEFDGYSYTKKIPLSINKSCSAVNTIKPQIAMSSLLIGKNLYPCKAAFTISNNDNDEGIASVFVDETLTKEYIVRGNGNTDFDLASGSHSYKITYTDQANNVISTSKDFKCLDQNNTAFIAIDGNRGAVKERLRVPPPPGGNRRLYKNLKFDIKNIARNDYSQIKSISVTQSGEKDKIFYLSNANNGIEQLTYNLNIALRYNFSTTINVKVILYNGRVLENSKTYEVR